MVATCHRSLESKLIRYSYRGLVIFLFVQLLADSGIDSFSVSVPTRFCSSSAISVIQLDASPSSSEEALDGYERYIRQQLHQADIINAAPARRPSATRSEATIADAKTQTRSHPSVPRNNIKGTSKAQHRIYTRDPLDDTSIAVDEETVYHLISQRTKAQRRGDYAMADRIRDELNEIHGVYVWDTDALWSASPIAPARRRRAAAISSSKSTCNRNNNHTESYDFQDEETPQDFGKNGHDYRQCGGSIQSKLNEQDIHKLIAKRLAFKLLKQFTKADQIQQLLYQNGIRIHDGFKLWRADGLIFDDIEGALSGKPFTQSDFSLPLPADQHSLLQDIESLMERRAQARARRDYNKADSLRAQLWQHYRVAVDDKTRTWSLGGDFGPNGSFRWTDQGPVAVHRHSSTTYTKPIYTMSPYSSPFNDPSVQQEVRNLIHDRLEAQRIHDFAAVDFIQHHLLETYNVSINDVLRQYSIGGDFGSNGES